MNDNYTKNELRKLLNRFGSEDKAVLIQIPQVSSSCLDQKTAKNRGYFAYPPTGLLYLSKILRNIGIQTKIIDLNYYVLEYVQNSSSDINTYWRNLILNEVGILGNPMILISNMFDLTTQNFIDTCKYIRSNRPDLLLVAGGVSATANRDSLLSEEVVDIVISYEGELALEYFIQFYRKATNDLPFNVSFRDSKGKIIHTPFEPNGNLDLDIRSEYELIPIKKYCRVGSISNLSRLNGRNIPFATVQSRRGCRGRCTFCGVRNFSGKNVRVGSVKRVVTEMLFLYKNYGIRFFDWLDDDLLFDEKEAIALFNEIGEKMPDISWAANNGLVLASITPELMNSMAYSGCIGFKVGLESGNPKILKEMKKPVTLDKFFSFSQMAQAYPQMHISVCFILGIPGETFGQLLDTFLAALKGQLDWNNFYLYQPIKNTELFDVYFQNQSENRKKTKSAFNVNPVRGGAFKNQFGKIESGYDVFEIDPTTEPERDQLNEIWFTFNTIVNFLNLPAFFTDSEIRLQNAIRWFAELSMAYPDDPLMLCVLYFLKKRAGNNRVGDLANLKDLALQLINRSAYWKERDKQFNYSAFLDNTIPDFDNKLLRIKEYQKPLGAL